MFQLVTKMASREKQTRSSLTLFTPFIVLGCLKLHKWQWEENNRNPKGRNENERVMFMR